MFNCVNIFIASIFLNSVSPTLFSVFSVYTNAFGLRACAADVANIQLVFGYNSCLKCAAKCSNTINCVGCNYQAGSKSCSLFVNCTKLATRYNTLNTCVLYQNKKLATGLSLNDVKANYLGCYTDKPNPNRDFSIKAFDDLSALTTAKCWKACIDLNYTVFGTQYSYTCFCTHFFGRYGQSVGCNSKCTGALDEFCGGVYLNSVYTVCDRGMYGLKCNMSCPCGPQCVCHRLDGTVIL
ncbi:hypothetical protein HELRODRAFT_179326 [Helobdella robusta]|uniref:WSC domain-containing protein n=1 Tax=Helobdella robusta TaxID=6412 RepID=T1FEJ9_HELRO|nr:hypothetical protein HELRODRAFT_179326 [Helobdella robusta]ESN95550.1 hypothetical protein HELRODRAFT_179326 [Helobdella robusta]